MWVGSFKKHPEGVSKDHPIDCDNEPTAKYFTFITLFIGLRGWDLKQWSMEETVEFPVTFLMKCPGLHSE